MHVSQEIRKISTKTKLQRCQGIIVVVKETTSELSC